MANGQPLIELHKLPRVAYRFEVAQELLARDNHRTSAIVGVEAEALGTLQVLVEEEVHMAFLVVDKSEGRHRARLQAEVALHTLWRSETQFALMQTVLHIVNCHILVAVEADQVVAITLVVAEKEVFAVHRAIVTPILLGNLDSRRLGVKIDLILYVMSIEELKNPLAA